MIAVAGTSSGCHLRECALGEDSFVAGLYAWSGNIERFGFYLKVLTGGMRAARAIDERNGVPLVWT